MFTWCLAAIGTMLSINRFL